MLGLFSSPSWYFLVIGKMSHVNSLMTQPIETFVFNFSIIVFLFCITIVMTLILIKVLWSFVLSFAQNLNYDLLFYVYVITEWTQGICLVWSVIDKINHCIVFDYIFLNFSAPVHPKVQFLHQGQAAFLWLLTLYLIKCHQGSWSQGCSSELSQPRVWLSHHNHQHLPQHSHNPSIRDGHEFFGTIWNGKVG